MSKKQQIAIDKKIDIMVAIDTPLEVSKKMMDDIYRKLCDKEGVKIVANELKPKNSLWEHLTRIKKLLSKRIEYNPSQAQVYKPTYAYLKERKNQLR